MEVFLGNVPAQLTDRSLTSQLKPLMDNLKIDDASYHCEKAKKKNIGFLTFLYKTDGEKFLDAYKELPGGSRSIPRLTIMNTRVFCKLSNRQPTQLALETLRYQVEQRKIQKEKLEEQKKRKDKEGKSQPDKGVDNAAIVLEASQTSCGHWIFDPQGRFTFVAEWTHLERCTAKFTKWNLHIKTHKAEIRIPFPTIQELVWSENGSVAVTLNSAPTFLTPQLFPDLLAQLGALSLNKITLPRHRLPSIDLTGSHSKISSFCMVYYFKVQIAVTHRRIHGSDMYRQIKKLKDKDLFTVTNYDFEFTNRGLWSASFDQDVDKLKKLLGKCEGTLPFSFIFMLQRLVYDGFLNPMTVYHLTQKLVSLFKSNTANRYPISEEAFRKLFRMDYPSPNSDPRTFDVDGIMDFLKKSETEIRGGFDVGSVLFKETDSLVRIYRAIVTPSRIYLEEGMEAKNRILRKFPNHQDYFMRVQFCDENGQDLYFNPRISIDHIYDRFKKVLANGISIGGRVYRFLGFSHSSLRSHSVWLSAPFMYGGRLQIPDLIITGLGVFDSIRSPARRAARIGQAFSETPYTVSLDDFGISVVKIPDVERNNRVFSDGVGPMSMKVLEAIHSVIPESKGFPTCVQFRWAGAKGMLALDPELPGNQFCIRPSMEKFTSEDTLNLEICDLASKPIPMVLNRQLVKILEDMGAPESWFMELQEKELDRLRLITSSTHNTASFLRAQSIGEFMGLSKLLRQADNMGVDYRRDQFLLGVVNAVVLKELRLLKHKARISVPEGITLFGIMDETGFLQENQVFVTYDTMQGRHEPPPESSVRVLVTRSPALHPGDIQLATNIIPPDGHPLRELGNCVVFSQRGARDLPSQLSGGDLDGDVFNVIWDPALVSTVRTFPPANYARVDELVLDRPVETSDMANFFIDFMKTDHLGVIATRHMILADLREQGTLDRECIALAELHSSAVDFSKTGRPVELSQLPRPPKARPDFLAPGSHVLIHNQTDLEMQTYMHEEDDEDEDNDNGPRHQYYYSKRILGKLFQAIDEDKVWYEDINRRISPKTGASFWDQIITKFRERIKGIGEIDWRHRTEEARRLRHAYDHAIEELMIEHAENPSQPLKELEVFVGFIINKTGVQTRRQRDRSTRLKDEFERVTTWIMRQMRNPPTPSGGLKDELAALELCLACVCVGCMKEEGDVVWYNTRRFTREIESFRVVAACALLKELNFLKAGMGRRSEKGGGGYVGVR